MIVADSRCVDAFAYVYEAIITASLHEMVHPHIFSSCAGIIFLGTPHRGSKTQSWADLIGSIAHKLDMGIERSLP